MYMWIIWYMGHTKLHMYMYLLFTTIYPVHVSHIYYHLSCTCISYLLHVPFILDFLVFFSPVFIFQLEQYFWLNIYSSLSLSCNNMLYWIYLAIWILCSCFMTLDNRREYIHMHKTIAYCLIFLIWINKSSPQSACKCIHVTI